MSQEHLSQLAALRTFLFEMHREFLVTLKSEREKSLGGPLSGTDWLNLLITHPDYAWVAPLNHLLTDVDVLSDLGVLEPTDLTVIKKALEDLFFKESDHPFFKKYHDWVLNHPELMVAHGRLREVFKKLPSFEIAVIDAKKVRENWHQRAYQRRRNP